MTTEEWVKILCERNLICEDYKKRIGFATSKSDLFKIICDTNGLTFFADLCKSGAPVPFHIFCEEYSKYINGAQTVTYPSGATSKLYIKYTGTLTADTTLLGVYDSKCDIIVPPTRFPRLVLGWGSDVNILVQPGARLTLEVYNNAKFNISGDQTRVRIKRF